ncbi:hypothetical protein JCM1840_000092 [Sporobolomyces johnsonii]
MESLNHLGSALPPEQGEEMQKAFRQAALALTGLYKSGKQAAAKAYITGKKEALQDVLEFLQASLDHPHPSSSAAAGPLSVGRLIDYICARQEALKAEEEDNDDDDSPAAAPPRRPTSAAQAPPSPHRPGVFNPRPSTSSSTYPTSSANNSRPSSTVPRQPPPPVASTSSAPASPTFSPSSGSPFIRPPLSLFSSHSHAASLPPPSSIPASPSPLSSTVNLPLSPLARSASSHPRSLRSRNSSRGKATSVGTSGAATPLPLAGAAGAGAADDSAEVELGLGMKRRWGIPAAPADEVLEVQNVQEATSDEESGHERGGSEGMDMDMEGWDGVGERPYKRLTRSSRSSAQGSTAGGPGPGGAAGGGEA